MDDQGKSVNGDLDEEMLNLNSEEKGIIKMRKRKRFVNKLES